VLLLWVSPAAAESAQATSVPVEPTPVEIQFATSEPGITVYSRPVSPARLTGTPEQGKTPEFQAVCTAPCEALLDPAVHEFALAPAGGAPIAVASALELRGDAELRGDFVSHASERRTGYWILGIMGTLGVTSTTIGMMQTCVDDQTCQQWTSLAIWSGIALTAAGALIGIPKITRSDEARLTLVAGTAPLADPSLARLPDGVRSVATLSGATLSGHF
jgi:hypothetical protein